jgi:hypothetical protein
VFKFSIFKLKAMKNLLFCLFCLQISIIEAQTVDDYYFNSYDQATAILADEQYLWIGTTKGLVQRRLSDMKVCAIYNSTTVPAIIGIIEEMTFDPNGRLWLRTDKPAIYHQTEKNGTFIQDLYLGCIGFGFTSASNRIQESYTMQYVNGFDIKLPVGTWRLLSNKTGTLTYRFTCHYNCWATPGIPNGTCFSSIYGLDKLTNTGWVHQTDLFESLFINAQLNSSDGSIWWSSYKRFTVWRNNTLDSVYLPVNVLAFSFTPAGETYFIGTDQKLYKLQNDIAIPINSLNAAYTFTPGNGGMTINPTSHIFTGSNHAKKNGIFEFKNNLWVNYEVTEFNEYKTNNVAQANNGDKWFFSPIQLTLLHHDTAQRFEFNNQPLDSNGVVTWNFPDASGRLWITMNNKRRYVFDQNSWTKLDTIGNEVNYLDNTKIWSDSLGKTWFLYKNAPSGAKCCQYKQHEFISYTNFDSLIASTAFPNTDFIIQNDTLIRLSKTYSVTPFPLPNAWNAHNTAGLLRYYFSNQSGIVWAAHFDLASDTIGAKPVDIYRFQNSNWTIIKENFELTNKQKFIEIIPNNDWALLFINAQYSLNGPTPTLFFMNGVQNLLQPTTLYENLNSSQGSFSSPILKHFRKTNELYLHSKYTQNLAQNQPPSPTFYYANDFIKVSNFGAMTVLSDSIPTLVDNKGVWWYINNKGFYFRSTEPSIPFYLATDNKCNDGKGFAGVLHGSKAQASYYWSNEVNTSMNMISVFNQNYDISIAHGGDNFTKNLLISGVPLIKATAQFELSDSTGNNGSIALNVTGGNPPYQFLWSNNDVTNVADSLENTIYSVNITDSSGCVVSENIAVALPLQITFTGKNASCWNVNDAFVAAHVSGGFAPYTFHWYNSASTNDTLFNATGSSNYGLTVTDAKSQTLVGVYHHAEPTPSLIQLGQTLVLPATDTSKGSIELHPNNGIAPYTYLWDNGATNNLLINLEANNYNVTVTDNNGCTRTQIFKLWKPLEVTLEKSICESPGNRFIIGKPTFGVKPYSFLWENQSTNNTLQNLTSGTFTLTVTDAVGNEKVQTTVLANPVPLEIFSTFENPTSSTFNNGYITLHLFGGDASNSILWNTGSTATNLTNLGVGTYTVVVTYGDGCTAYAIFNLTTTSKIEEKEAGLIDYYPNPTSDVFKINLPNTVKNGVINIYDTQKKLFKTYPVFAGENEIPVQMFPEGAYLLRLIVDELTWSKLLVVQR